MNYLNLGKDDKQLKEIARVVENGGLVVFPFDTCYVFVVDPTNQEAVNKLYEIKGRAINKAISVAVCDLEMAGDYTKLTNSNKLIMQKLLPGPFTVVVEGKHKLAKGIEAMDGSLGIRIPDFKPVLDLAKALGKPITATSANVSGQNICHSLASLKKQLSAKKWQMVDLWVDGGQLAIRQASTVMDIRGRQIKTLRRGEIMMDESGQRMLSESVGETKAIAKLIWEKVMKTKSDGPVVFLLTGELGCGKTVFAKKIGEILGVKKKIVSPTFNIVNSYKINHKSQITSNPNKIQDPNSKLQNKFKEFIHIDLYRISEENELEEIKFMEMFDKNTVSCIEWPEVMGKKYMDELKKKTRWVMVWFEYGEKEKERKIRFRLK